MKEFEFDHLEDLTYRVLWQVNDDLINYLKSKTCDDYENEWEQILEQTKGMSVNEFVFKYEIAFADISRESFLIAMMKWILEKL